ncbi:hypothetical protein EJ05DRAFT_483902 [Pseudovirgaria hyperparasitica]|uniref:mitogen-activated protein kinase kinase n=1 Tax=Pseudovirgaria hyperparasitica TaxID=470096 RepID=A0A6A6WD62_9PEZI|nr:uncharacterized protein EJ05DRAFT_483902 [Pseudovirgaria hyperparasitica]KAF2760119.1 hypothetical protein EJ05DRAFT_483902 [Pseudovirgaria hyperparasitica]
MAAHATVKPGEQRKLGLGLDDFFPTGLGVQQYTDADCKEICRILLEELGPPYSTVPRIYIVLRIIDQVSLLPKFTSIGCTDLWFPFNKQSLPRSLSQSHQDLFLEVQGRVITKGLDLENDEKKHVHFVKGEELPLLEKGMIAKGGYGVVDKVQSQLSGREYARKSFRRGGTRTSDLKSFATELQVLKRINHQHCVELVASYTDPKFFGFLMLPVAECDLEQYFTLAMNEDEYKLVLNKAFGCLASALAYLHEERIRHRDIKPSNILIKKGQVYFTDFGISLDWQDRTRSTTTGNFGKSIPYCAPEVQNYEKRNSKSDVFSLGCVFVEILTALCGRTIRDMRDTFKRKTETFWFSNNIASAKEWIRDLKTSLDQAPIIDWIDRTVALHEDARMTSVDLYKTICSPQAALHYCCEHCLLEDDSSSGADDDPRSWDVTYENTQTEGSCENPDATHPVILPGITNNTPISANTEGKKPEDNEHVQEVVTLPSVVVQPPEPVATQSVITEVNLQDDNKKSKPHLEVNFNTKPTPIADSWAPTQDPKDTVADQKPRLLNANRRAEWNQFQSFSDSFDLDKLKPVSPPIPRMKSTTPPSDTDSSPPKHYPGSSDIALPLTVDTYKVGRSIVRPSQSLSRIKAGPSGPTPREDGINKRFSQTTSRDGARRPHTTPLPNVRVEDWDHPQKLGDTCRVELRRFASSTDMSSNLPAQFEKHPRSKLPDVIAFFLKIGLDPNARSGPDEATALHHLIRNFAAWKKYRVKLPDLARLIKILVDAGADVNSVAKPPVFGKSGQILSQTSPLYWAVSNNDEEAVAMLLDQGADCQNDFHNLLVLAGTKGCWGVLEELTGKTNSHIRSKKRKAININVPLKGGATMAGVALIEVQPETLEFLINRYCYELSQELTFGAITSYLRINPDSDELMRMRRDLDLGYADMAPGVSYNNPFVICSILSMADKLAVLVRHRYPLRMYLTEPVYSYILKHSVKDGHAEVAELLLDARPFEVQNTIELWGYARKSAKLRRILVEYRIPEPKSSKRGTLLGLISRG